VVQGTEVVQDYSGTSVVHVCRDTALVQSYNVYWSRTGLQRRMSKSGVQGYWCSTGVLWAQENYWGQGYSSSTGVVVSYRGTIVVQCCSVHV